jgi:uncharacterized protein YgfB (UPF0149 family)
MLAEAVGVAEPGAGVRANAQALVAWMNGFVAEIGLAALWSGAGVDAALPARLAKDVFAYM